MVVTKSPLLRWISRVPFEQQTDSQCLEMLEVLLGEIALQQALKRLAARAVASSSAGAAAALLAFYFVHRVFVVIVVCQKREKAKEIVWFRCRLDRLGRPNPAISFRFF